MVILVPYVAFILATIMAFASLILKAGYSRWWTIAVFVPVVNMVAFFCFAFRPWPIAAKRNVHAAVGHQQ